jgi:hypothetical protein
MLSRSILANRKGDVGARVHDAMLLLLVLHIRSKKYNLDNSLMGNWVETNKELTNNLWDFWNRYFQLEMKTTIGELMSNTVKEVVEIHNEIAHQKAIQGNDTHRFVSAGPDYFRFKRDYEYTKRGDRIDTIRSILEDTGVLTMEGGRLILTEYGMEVLKSHVPD